MNHDMSISNETLIRWIEALRSGKYRQGEGVLAAQDDDGVYSYCCLGVLGRVCGLSNQDLDGRRMPRDSSTCQEPWHTGLDNATESTLASLNDNSRLSFEKIADIIEENRDRLVEGRAINFID